MGRGDADWIDQEIHITYAAASTANATNRKNCGPCFDLIIFFIDIQHIDFAK